jgi:hypothetical protein
VQKVTADISFVVFRRQDLPSVKTERAMGFQLPDISLSCRVFCFLMSPRVRIEFADSLPSCEFNIVSEVGPRLSLSLEQFCARSYEVSPAVAALKSGPRIAGQSQFFARFDSLNSALMFF